ncbi:MAG TPA: hypothetical protein VIF62_25140 [Labilithrix sp.]|jgi:hypothetical protein
MNESRGYEFDPKQNDVIEKLGRSMHVVGIFMFVFGVLGLVGSVLAIVTHQVGPQSGFAESLVMTLFGFWTQRAGGRFTKIVKTTGNDVTHLMAALDDLRKMYGVVRFVIVFCFVLLVAFFVVAMVSGLWATATHH